MSPEVIISLVFSVCIAIFASITAPIVLQRRLEKQHTADREADWARQDEVAARAAEAIKATADALAASQKKIADQATEAAQLLLAANERVAGTTRNTNDKLDIIHTLVNSNMTTAMENELGSAERELAMMREVVVLKREMLHQEPTIEALTAIETSKSKIAELKLALHDRSVASDLAGRGSG